MIPEYRYHLVHFCGPCPFSRWLNWGGDGSRDDGGLGGGGGGGGTAVAAARQAGRQAGRLGPRQELGSGSGSESGSGPGPGFGLGWSWGLGWGWVQLVGSLAGFVSPPEAKEK